MELEKKVLAEQLQKYIMMIEKEYGSFITEENDHQLEKIKKDPEKSIEWNTDSTISLFAKDDKIYFPLASQQVFTNMSKLTSFGIQNDHKSCTSEHYIENDLTFHDYIKHAIIKGLTPLEYFEENLLHEVMHLCGGGGSSSLEEGLTELKTREIAQKYELLTSGCGYPKEVKIALRLKEILGSDTIDQVTFLGDDLREVEQFLICECGKDTSDFYFSVRSKMKEKSSSYRQKLRTISDPLQKQLAYDQINYQEVHHMIDEFQKRKQK